MRDIFEAVGLLTPYDIDVPKTRFGPRRDGGYVFADCVAPAQNVISYGIADQYEFDLEMAERGHQVFMFDHTIEGISRRHPNMHYFREGVAGASDPSGLVYAVADHLARHRIVGDQLILKMDVEGAEYEALAAMDDATLLRFEQIVIEVHELQRLVEPDFRARFRRIFTALNRHFTLFHVHANNHNGPFNYVVVGGAILPDLIELSYIRTAKVTRRASATLYPSAIDYPNLAHRDKLLWFYPFMPTAVPADAFLASIDRLDEQDREMARLVVSA